MQRLEPVPAADVFAEASVIVAGQRGKETTNRPKASERGYDYRWQKFSRWFRTAQATAVHGLS